MPKVQLTLEADPKELYEAIKENQDKVMEIVALPVIAMLLGVRPTEREQLRLSMLKIGVKHVCGTDS